MFPVAEAWRDRLEATIIERGISMRALSLSAGLGPSYISGILREGKEPTIDKMLALCKALNVSISWLLYGANVTPVREEILRFLEKNPEAEEAILKLLRAMPR